MRTVTLPLLPPDTEPQDAYKAMRWLERSAIIRATDYEKTLVSVGKVVNAVARNWPDLKDISQGQTVYEITEKDAGLDNLSLSNPEHTKSAYDEFFTRTQHDFALVDSAPGLALVAFHSDEMAQKYSMAPGTCYCEGPDEHPYKPPPIPPNQICQDCSNKIRCVGDGDSLVRKKSSAFSF